MIFKISDPLHQELTELAERFGQLPHLPAILEIARSAAANFAASAYLDRPALRKFPHHDFCCVVFPLDSGAKHCHYAVLETKSKVIRAHSEVEIAEDYHVTRVLEETRVDIEQGVLKV